MGHSDMPPTEGPAASSWRLAAAATGSEAQRALPTAAGTRVLSDVIAWQNSAALKAITGLHCTPAFQAFLGLHKSPVIDTFVALQTAPAVRTAVHLQSATFASIAGAYEGAWRRIVEQAQQATRLHATPALAALGEMQRQGAFAAFQALRSPVFVQAAEVADRLQHLAPSVTATVEVQRALTAGRHVSRLLDDATLNFLGSARNMGAELQQLQRPAESFHYGGRAVEDVLHEHSSESLPPATHEADLEARLELYGHDLVRMYQGARYAVETAGPDAFRQAAHSMRELLRVLLERLAPESAIPLAARDPEHGVTRRVRVRHVARRLPRNQAALITGLETLVASLHPLLSDVAHTGREVPLSHCLHSTEALLLHLLWAAEHAEDAEHA